MFYSAEDYKEIIYDNYSNPRNKCLSKDKDYCTCEMKNPSCGDELVVQVKKHGDTIEDCRHNGHGCSICCASASIMSELVKGKSEAEAKHLYDEFMSMVSGGEYDEELLDEAAAFKGVAQLPARIKCATLCWKGMHRLLDELDKDEGENSGK
ncbi:MAG TPA: SUF system NifU family Fe-S cluster assembly protein [Firmicutes bacterium]|nr:SUF system NifU family Fe-S cluster assembly protein [Bacillota bacterium]